MFYHGQYWNGGQFDTSYSIRYSLQRRHIISHGPIIVFYVKAQSQYTGLIEYDPWNMVVYVFDVLYGLYSRPFKALLGEILPEIYYTYL